MTLANFINNGSRCVRVVYKSSFVSFHIYKDMCYLYSFGSYEREQGHGTEVLNACRRMARKLGKKLVLTASPFPLKGQEPYSLDRLVAYYEKRGFKPTNKRTAYICEMEYVA